MKVNQKETSYIIKLILLGSLSIAITGCASQPDYRCDIPDDCAPVYKNYKLAVNDERPEGWVSQGADPSLPPGVKASSDHTPEDKQEAPEGSDGLLDELLGNSEEVEQESIRPFVRGEVDVHEGPVFVPPKPHRIWLAHWKGGNGELNSGNYTYLTTPGYYLYMGDKYLALPYGVASDGAAAAETFNGIPRATFSPVRPTNYGFEPEESKSPEGTLDDMVQPKQEG